MDDNLDKNLDSELQNKITAVLKNCPCYVNFHLQYIEKEAFKYTLKVFFLDNNFIFCKAKNEIDLIINLEKKLKRSIYWKQYILNFDLDL
jgi:hypothetical protein